MRGFGEVSLALSLWVTGMLWVVGMDFQTLGFKCAGVQSTRGVEGGCSGFGGDYCRFKLGMVGLYKEIRIPWVWAD